MEMEPHRENVVPLKKKGPEHPEKKAFENPRGTITHLVNDLSAKILGQIDPDRKTAENNNTSLIKEAGEHAREIRLICKETNLDPKAFEEFFDAAVMLLSQPNEINRADFDKKYEETMEAIESEMAENYPSENDGISAATRI